MTIGGRGVYSFPDMYHKFHPSRLLLGRRLADPTVLETLGVNFRQPAGPKARLHTPRKNDIFCDQSRGYFPHIWEFLALISADFLIV